MRRLAIGLMVLGVLVAAVGAIVLTWQGNLHKPFSHNEGISIALFLLGGAITYLGMLVRRRERLVKDRERAA